jgi:hypothetical protein
MCEGGTHKFNGKQRNKPITSTKICFLGSGGVVFLSGWKIPTSRKSVTISLFVEKKLPNFQEIILGVEFCHISTHILFSVLKQPVFYNFFVLLMLNLCVYNVFWIYCWCFTKKTVPKKQTWIPGVHTWQHFPSPFSKYLQIMILFAWVSSVVGHALYAHRSAPINLHLHGCCRRNSCFLKQSLHFWLKTLLSRCCSSNVAPAPHIWKYSISYW